MDLGRNRRPITLEEMAAEKLTKAGLKISPHELVDRAGSEPKVATALKIVMLEFERTLAEMGMKLDAPLAATQDSVILPSASA